MIGAFESVLYNTEDSKSRTRRSSNSSNSMIVSTNQISNKKKRMKRRALSDTNKVNKELMGNFIIESSKRTILFRKEETI